MSIPLDDLAVVDDLPAGSHQRSFRSMGTDVHVLVVGGPDSLLQRARDRIEELERRWSRFLPDSEVSRLNAAGGTALAVSTDTLRLVELARHAWTLTDGWFDPTVLPALRAAGYDRSFEQLVAAEQGPMAVPTPPLPPGLAAAEVDRAAGTVRLPAPVQFDPGGIGKGLAADLVVDEMLEAGAEGGLVNLGGDLRVAGTSPDGLGWGIEIDTVGPWPAQLSLIAGAVATSTPRRRRWVQAGRQRHHLIDPGTGRPAAHPAPAITVVAGQAWQAEVLATAALLAGPRARDRMLRDNGASALLQFDDDRPVALAGMEAFLR